MKYCLLILLIALQTSVSAQTFTWTGSEPIMDNQTDTIPISISGLPAIINGSFGIAHICLDINHTNDSSLHIRLVSPDNTIVVLIEDIGGKGDNFTGTCMGMDGTHFHDSWPPFTGLFEPVGDVNDFNNGQNPNGTWKLLVSDLAAGDVGTINSVSLAFTNNPPGGGGGHTTGPTGNYVWPGAVCPGGASACDLLPDMTSSYKDIFLNHSETPGFLDISNTTPNIGYGPIEIYGIDSCYCGTTPVPCNSTCPTGDIKRVIMQRVYQKVNGTDTLSFYDRPAGLMTHHASHGHLHVDNWAEYTLRTPTSNPDATTWPIVGAGTKLSFCLINLGTCNGNPGACIANNGDTVRNVPNQNLGFHTGCGLTQGIFPGNYDVYSMSLNDPIILNNVCNGNYYIVSITDPENNFVESDETNNWVAVPITLTQQNPAPVITPSGSVSICTGNSVVLTSSVANNYLWSNGATTRSIVVSAAGSYTVSTDCGSYTTTSAPVVVNLINQQVTATATPNVTGCNGGNVQLNAVPSTVGTQTVPVSLTSNQQVFIPDNNSTGVTSTINVSGFNPTTVSASTVVSVKINITHTYNGDLAISLIAPSGESRFLSNRRGGSGDNFVNTVFSMSAATLIGSGSAPFTGTYKPDGNLNTYTGNVNGDWKLRVQDLAGVDTGRIQNWTITINNVVPETMSYSWTSSPPGFSSTLSNPVVFASTSTTYTATVTSSATGCTGSDTAAVHVPGEMAISNFSPVSGPPGTLVNIEGTGFNNATSVSIAGITSSNFTIISPTLIQATVPSGSANGPICVYNSAGCSYCSAASFNIEAASLTLNLKLFIEGFYISSGQMRATVNPGSYPTLCDTITVELRQPVSPYALVHSVKGTIDIYGNGSFDFPTSASGGNFYLAIRHRNSIEAWSYNPVVLNSPVVSYDFTTGLNKVFGNNVSSLGDGNFALYGGDVNQDGSVDMTDMTNVEEAASIFRSGYFPEDLTGNGLVESPDCSLLENNITRTLQQP